MAIQPTQTAIGPAINIDHYGSTRSLALDSSLNTVCTRRGYVTVDDNDFDSMTEAIWKVFSAGGGFTFPPATRQTENLNFFDTLPLNRITATRWGPNRIRIVARYKYHRSSFPPQDPNDLAQFSEFTYYIPTWRHARDGNDINNTTGLPEGPWNAAETVGVGDDAVIRPSTEQWPRHAVRIWVPWQLSANPYSFGVDALTGTTNSGAITFGGRSFDANTVRYDGVQIDPQEVNGDLIYRCWFKFAAQRGEWVQQTLDGTQGAYKTGVGNMYRPTWTASAFDFS